MTAERHDRRRFLKRAATAGVGALLGVNAADQLLRAAAASAGGIVPAAAYPPEIMPAAASPAAIVPAEGSPAAVRSAIQRVTLGRTGIETSFLAQGTGTRGWARTSDQVKLGSAAFEKLLRHSLDQGINLLDLADSYGSHGPAARALRGVPRDSYVIQTKLWPQAETWNRPSGGARLEIDRFRRELRTDVIDICLVHGRSDPGWARSYAQVRDDLAELKQAGIVRAAGLSCHSHEVLKAAVNDPWVDVIFARINYAGGAANWMDDSAEAVATTLLRARAAGKAVIGMKIFGAGRLTDPESRDRSLRFVLDRRLVDAVSIGMCSPLETDDVIARIAAAGRG